MFTDINYEKLLASEYRGETESCADPENLNS